MQDEIALVGSKIKNMKNYNDKLRVENEMLRERLNNITDKATQATGIYISFHTLFLLYINEEIIL